MRHGILGAVFLAVALVQPAPAADQDPNTEPDLGANAALKYWKAFTLLPALDGTQEKMLESNSKMPLDAAQDLIGKYQRCRVYLLRGASLPRCDWGEDHEDGLRLILPHVPKAMTLARLATLNARNEFAQGHWRTGADDVAAVLRLAHHIEMDRITISSLVAIRMETIAIEAAAAYLPELKALLPELASAVEDSSLMGATLAEMVLIEKKIGPMWLIRELKSAEQREPGSWRAVWKDVLEAPGEKGADADETRARTIKTYEEALAAVNDLLPLYDLLAHIVTLPPGAFDAQFADFASRAKTSNPLAGFFLPNMDKVAESHRRSEARRSLFKAAIAVVQNGPDALKTIKDPFGDGPFEYRALEKGFELKSKFIAHGQPVTLAVGHGKKP